ncbi:MAG: 50S ribosomal protein L19 [Patescibacteria group bacterium]
MISAKFGEVNIHIGDSLRVYSKLMEGDKVRTQVYEGVLLRIRGRGENTTFTVRRIGTGGIGVERTWPLNSNSLVKIEVKKKATKIRRSKLYYLRNDYSHA